VFQSASEDAIDITSTGIPMPVRQGMKLLAPSIQRLCNVVLAALEEENQATVLAVGDLDATRLGLLKKRRACCSEELQRLHRALSLQEDVFNGMFKCGEQAVGARKRAKRELKQALQANQKPEVIENLTASEEKCFRNIKQFIEWCTIAKKAKDLLQSRYNEEELALADVDKDIEELQVLHDSRTPTADTRCSDVQAFMLFMCST
jgi:hypothetical protein